MQAPLRGCRGESPDALGGVHVLLALDDIDDVGGTTRDRLSEPVRSVEQLRDVASAFDPAAVAIRASLPERLLLPVSSYRANDLEEEHPVLVDVVVRRLGRLVARREEVALLEPERSQDVLELAAGLARDQDATVGAF